MTRHLVPCCTSVLKLINLALQDESSAIMKNLHNVLGFLSYIFNKLLLPFSVEISQTKSKEIPFDKDQKEQLSFETVQILRQLLIHFVRDKHRKLLIEEDAGILHCFEDFLLGISVNFLIQKRLALEVARLWTQLAALSDGRRVQQMAESLWERVPELIRDRNKGKRKAQGDLEFSTDPAIQLLQGGQSYVLKRIQLNNYLLLRSIQAHIVARSSNNVTKILLANVEAAKQELK